MKHVIQIHMTNACNLKCEYCYINQNSKKLTFDVLKKQIKNIQYLSKKIDDSFDGEYDVTYFGGEPLLEYENILLFDEYLKTNLNVVHSFMQTNGILLNDKIKNEFDTRNIHIGISCDGCNDNNHKYIEQLYKNKIVEMQPKMMIDNHNVYNMMKNIVYFYKLAMKNDIDNFYIDVSFVKDNIWDKNSLNELKNQVNNLYDFMVMNYDNYNRWIYIGFVEKILQNLLNGKRNFICFAGSSGFSITPEGIIYPCSRFYTNHQYPLYDSNNDTYFEDNISYIKSINNTYNDKCNKCILNNFCNQGCLYSQIQNNGVIDGYCEVLKICFHMVTKLYQYMKNKYNINILNKEW